MASSYNESLALIIISSISIGIGAIVTLWLALDISIRRGWKSMMLIMIPVYIINALYLWPITLWTYLKYGRPKSPKKQTEGETMPSHKLHSPHAGDEPGHEHIMAAGTDAQTDSPNSTSQMANQHANNYQEAYHHHSVDQPQGGEHVMDHTHHHTHNGSDRPMFATVTIGVCHCGAGCVLGDIIGEWLVWGTNATINGRMLRPEFLIDFGFAIAFGILFQYYSIAPMAGDYGPKILWRALKADILSLLFFEIGVFAWMAIYQISIFNWNLEMNTVTYWWMMQIGMFLGHWTAVPMNYYLIKNKVK